MTPNCQMTLEVWGLALHLKRCQQLLGTALSLLTFR